MEYPIVVDDVDCKVSVYISKTVIMNGKEREFVDEIIHTIAREIRSTEEIIVMENYLMEKVKKYNKDIVQVDISHKHCNIGDDDCMIVKANDRLLMYVKFLKVRLSRDVVLGYMEEHLDSNMQNIETMSTFPKYALKDDPPQF